MINYLAAAICPIIPLFKKIIAKGAQSKGWGNQYVWWELEEGLEKSKEYNKPMVVIIHKMTCPACHRLKTMFSTNPEVATMSRSFIMVNLTIGEAAMARKIINLPEAGYVPKIYFYKPGGRVMPDIVYDPNSEFKYNYPDAESIAENMKKVRENVYKW